MVLGRVWNRNRLLPVEDQTQSNIQSDFVTLETDSSKPFFPEVPHYSFSANFYHETCTFIVTEPARLNSAVIILLVIVMSVCIKSVRIQRAA